MDFQFSSKHRIACEARSLGSKGHRGRAVLPDDPWVSGGRRRCAGTIRGITALCVCGNTAPWNDRFDGPRTAPHDLCPQRHAVRVTQARRRSRTTANETKAGCQLVAPPAARAARTGRRRAVFLIIGIAARSKRLGYIRRSGSCNSGASETK